MSRLKWGIGLAAISMSSLPAAAAVCEPWQVISPFEYCYGTDARVTANFLVVDGVKPAISIVKRFSGDVGEAGISYPGQGTNFAFEVFGRGEDGGFAYFESDAGTYGKAEASRTGVLRGLASALTMSAQEHTRPYWVQSSARFANTYHATWDASLGTTQDLTINLSAHGSVSVGPPDPEWPVQRPTQMSYILRAVDAQRNYLGSASAESSVSGTIDDMLLLPMTLQAEYFEDGIAHARFAIRGGYTLMAGYGASVWADNTFRLGFDVPSYMHVVDAVDGRVVSSIPEPSSANLAVFGLLMLPVIRRIAFRPGRQTSRGVQGLVVSLRLARRMT